MEAIFTVSKNADIIFDLRNFGISGFKNATNKKEGRNIPISGSKINFKDITFI